MSFLCYVVIVVCYCIVYCILGVFDCYGRSVLCVLSCVLFCSCRFVLAYMLVRVFTGIVFMVLYFRFVFMIIDVCFFIRVFFLVFFGFSVRCEMSVMVVRLVVGGRSVFSWFFLRSGGRGGFVVGFVYVFGSVWIEVRCVARCECVFGSFIGFFCLFGVY